MSPFQDCLLACIRGMLEETRAHILTCPTMKLLSIYVNMSICIIIMNIPSQH